MDDERTAADIAADLLVAERCIQHHRDPQTREAAKRWLAELEAEALAVAAVEADRPPAIVPRTGHLCRRRKAAAL
jgi:hypothetical protein